MPNVVLLRALAAEQRAAETSNPDIKKEWEAIAIEWHRLVSALERVKANARTQRGKD